MQLGWYEYKLICSRRSSVVVVGHEQIQRRAKVASKDRGCGEEESVLEMEDGRDEEEKQILDFFLIKKAMKRGSERGERERRLKEVCEDSHKDFF